MDDPNIKNADILALEKFLPYRLNQASEKVSQKFAQEYKKRYGLTRPEWRTFATIGQFGTITAREICNHSPMHKTKVSRAVFALEKRRWVKRTQDPTDRRLEHLELTTTGQATYKDLVNVANVFEEKFIQSIGDQDAQLLLRALDAIERRFEA
ncbi:MarR family winged helix-turn-helix transcriptional regulator [uncultured Maritalea sp.]|uniref:MarR family winged helix-turn-helix transcriptional regulator n=1 Tax=uncultured Maritalea sp. TaxID=757249 RepID=UPI00261DB1AE|nr:MarR family winged helix-turn-helix transcriptional regulator [uncultured Maritalea sp.]